MDIPSLSAVPKINLQPRSHKRNPSLSPTRSPTRQRITEDILSDLSPATTLEAFTSESPSGKLRASVEAATPSERAFGIRATLAGKKIQEWADELSAWPWPTAAGAKGFEIPTAKRRRLDTDTRVSREGHPDAASQQLAEVPYMGSLPAHDVLEYETRIDEIEDDMEELDVEGIKKTVLNTHFSARSRPSSSASEVAPMPSSLLSYTKMDDFTAIVTATVLQSLPILSRLTRMMDVWSIRLSVLRKVPPLLDLLADAEVALKSGWQAIQVSNQERDGEEAYLQRKAFDVMKNVLQDKVTALGQDLDFMLDALEGREDTLPEHWLDRMEKIEADYGEWVVSGDRKVREGEWARMAKRRKEEEERRKAEEAEKEAKRLEEESLRKLEEERLKAEQEAVRLEQMRLQRIEDERLRAEQEAVRLEQLRLQKIEDERLRAEQEAVRLERESRLQAEREVIRLEQERLEEIERNRLQTEQKADLAEWLRKLENDRLRTEHDAMLEEDRLEKLEEARSRAASEDAILEAEQLLQRDEGKLEEELEKVEAARLTIARIRREEFERLGASQEALDVARLNAEKVERDEMRADQVRANEATPDAAKLKTSSRRAEEDGRLVANDEAQDNGNLEGERIEDIEEHEEKLRQRDKSQIAELNVQQTRVQEDVKLRLQQDGLVTAPSLVEGIPEVNDTELRPATPHHSKAETSLKSILKKDPTVDYAESQQPRSKSAPERRDEDDNPEVEQISDSFSRKSTSTSNQTRYDGNSESRRSSMATQEVEHIPLQPVKSGLDSSDSAPPLRVLSPRPDTGAATSRLNPSALITDLHKHSKPLTSCNDSDHDDDKMPTPTPSNPWADQVSLASMSPQGSVSSKGKLGPHAPHSPTHDARNSPVQSSQTPERHDDQSIQRPPALPAHDGPTSISVDSDQPPVPHTPTFGATSPVKGANGIPANGDGVQESRIKMIEAIEVQDLTPATLDRHTSLTTADGDMVRVNFSNEDDDLSNHSTDIPQQFDATPIVPLSPNLTADTTEPFPDIEEQSPLVGRVGLRTQLFDDNSPSNSSPLKALPFDRHSMQLANAPELDTSPSLTPVTPTSDDAPNFPSLDSPPTAHPFPSPKKSTTDDQLQAQISNLLERIPARIRLTSEPDVDINPISPFLNSQNDTLRPKKVRRSLTPSVRSTSSMSMRAPTPSFTLAPAYSKSTPRPRHQNGNPEIKLYHLSRSTGEAPIKLFVRLVGENGERVMVRVGGGWADLGEYLREYASHHGRRVVSGATSDDKVEIQDLPSRIVSNSSTSNTRPHATQNGRSSPVSRPSSVLERERPMSSLYIRKTRRSLGEHDSSTLAITPSTPHPSSPPCVAYDTPPSGSARSVSRLSWTEDEGGLGLAGPKSKSKPISERDQEWVESMKEKVRLASAEKEKALQRKEALGAGRRSFGEMEKVGGTKRLFKKSG